MQVPRDVVVDLLPAYLSGEASPATRALVEAHLAGDPELARRLQQLRDELRVLEPQELQISSRVEKLEKDILERTKLYLKVRPLALMMGILFLLLPLMLSFRPEEGFVFTMFWQSDFPHWGAIGITAICVVNAVTGFLFYYRLGRRLRGVGL
jgi:hypothetical protein